MKLSLEDYIEGIEKTKDRRILSKAITLVESSRDSDRILAKELLGKLKKNFVPKIAVSGPPGVGKSSLLEKLGNGFDWAGKKDCCFECRSL